MTFEASHYGPVVAHLLQTVDSGQCLMPLVSERRPLIPELANASPDILFLNARHPRAALAGLYLCFSCWDQAHTLADSIEDPDGYFWHAIVHRQEPDAWNSGYWFRKVGHHPIFPSLAREASAIEPRFSSSEWDPYAFVKFCEDARGAASEKTAQEIQRAEWQLLFNHCARAQVVKGAAH